MTDVVEIIRDLEPKIIEVIAAGPQGSQGPQGATGVVTDGDYGDVTVSDTGRVLNINAGVVTTTELGGDITTAGKALLDDDDASAQRTTLGLGTAAVTDITTYATAAQGTLADTAIQPADITDVVRDSDIGSSVLAYDSNLQSFISTFTLPTIDGSNGFVLTTNGSGTLSFSAGGGGGGDLTDYIENTYPITYTDLGVLTTTITLDITKRWNIGEFTGTDTAYTINAITPTVSTLEPAHFTFVNNGSVTKTVSWDTDLFSIAGSTLSQVTLPIWCKLDFDVRRNPINGAVSYEVKIGDVNYNQTASGLSTTWNPSDKSPLLTLTNNNTEIEHLGANGTGACRAFGGKITGKWRIPVQWVTTFSDSNASEANCYFGITSADLPLNFAVGDTFTSYSLMNYYKRNSTGLTVTITQSKRTNAVNTSLGSQVVPSPGSLDAVLVDLDANKIWFTRNSTVLGGGDPEAGTGQDFNIQPDVMYYPAISLREVGIMNAGLHRLLNEVEDPYGNTWPSFNNWTA